MLSKASLDAIRAFPLNDVIPETDLPQGIDLALLPYLVSGGWLKKVSLVAPGVEPDCPNGLWAYGRLPAGQEALHQASGKKREKHNDRVFQVVLALVSFLLGLIAEHFVGITAWILAALH